jgi:oligosaccharide repeat unit polymerase
MKKKFIFIIFIILIIFINYLIIFNFVNIKSLLLLYFSSILIVIIYYINYVKFLSTTFVFILFYIMLFYTQPILFLLLDIPFNFSTNTVATYSIMATLGLNLFLIGNVLQFKSLKINNYIIEIKYKYFNRTIIFLSLLTILLIIFLFVDVGTINILTESRSSLKEGTILRTVASKGLHVVSILIILIVFSYRSRSKQKNLIWLLFFIFFEILIFLFFRTRTLIVEHIFALAVSYYYSNKIRIDKEIENKKFYSHRNLRKLMIITILALIFLFAIISRFYRGTLEPGSSENNFNIDIKHFIILSIENGDLGYSSTVMKLIESVPNSFNFLNGQSYYRILFIFIPRFLWEDKPFNTQQIVANWFFPERLGLSIPPGIIGDLYINFGKVGIFGMFFYGIFFRLLDQKFIKYRYFLWAFSGAWIFHLVRGGFTNPILILLMLLISLIIINKFLLNAKFQKINIDVRYN